MNIIRDIFD